jgi:DNA repair protein RadC
MRNRGVSALSLTELLQLIIGSGSAQLSGAKLARVVEEKVTQNDISLDMLKVIPGIGEAKACQILAALEVGKRLNPRE